MFKKLLKRAELELLGEKKEWHPVNNSMYCGRISDKEIDDMRSRNEKAIKECIKEMGEKWILHPSHKVERIHECK